MLHNLILIRLNFFLPPVFRFPRFFCLLHILITDLSKKIKAEIYYLFHLGGKWKEIPFPTHSKSPLIHILNANIVSITSKCYFYETVSIMLSTFLCESKTCLDFKVKITTRITQLKQFSISNFHNNATTQIKVIWLMFPYVSGWIWKPQQKGRQVTLWLIWWNRFFTRHQKLLCNVIKIPFA